MVEYSSTVDPLMPSSAQDIELTREHFQALIESSDDAIISKDLDGIVTSWNRGAQTIFGYTEEEMLGRPMLVIFPPDRVNEEAYILRQIAAGVRIDHFETERLHKNGNRINVSVTISPIRDRDGVVIGASKIARDITRQKASELQLRLTANVFTTSSEGILIAGSDGLIADVNQAFTRITGYSREEVLGKDPQIFSFGHQSPRIFRRMRGALMRNGEWKSELWTRRKDGEYYSVLTTISRVCDLNGIVSNYVALLTDITALKLQQEQLEHGAHFDTLTHLPNRLLLSDKLQQAMSICKRQQKILAVMYIDIDGFKVVNDTFDHGVGDELLIGISRQMRLVLREGDTLSRIGGDEFVVVLIDLDKVHDCIHLVQRLLTACSQPINVNDNPLSVSASIGVTLFPSDNVDADQLLRHADYAMYEAKRTGKNRYHLYDAAQDAELMHLSIQQSRIAQALDQEEFVLHFQPKVNMRTGTVIGAEALIRWQHPERGLLFPAAFLPLIEKNPLCELLGVWVLKSALQQMDTWRCKGLHLPVSINISARQFQDDHFASNLEKQLALHPNVLPADVELEILETSALDDIQGVQRIMRECHAIGVHFSLDDFGTGYSSLTYLRRLPVATLKIDQSFIRDMLTDAGDLSIVKGVIGLAQAFNRQVIAEGVETHAHGTALLALGCELGQGYAIAKPMPADMLAEWIADWIAPSEWLAALPKICATR